MKKRDLHDEIICWRKHLRECNLEEQMGCKNE